jgi:hypothetical protein
MRMGVCTARCATDAPLVDGSSEAVGGMEEHTVSKASTTGAELALKRAIIDARVVIGTNCDYNGNHHETKR